MAAEQDYLYMPGVREAEDAIAEAVKITRHYNSEIDRLKSALAAEQLRRESAEKVVDNCLKHPRIYSTTDSGAMAEAYRQRFPHESTGEG